MHEWVPVSTSPRGRLALVAVREFGSRRFDEVTVGQLSVAAEVTTGALYHHFGSKLGLYSFVRTDVERRLLDRMEGAAAGPHGTCQAALVVGFDYAVQQDYVFLLSETPPLGEPDRLASVLDRLSGPAPPPSGRILASAWRAALAAVADGTPSDQARSALELLLSPHHET